MTGESCIRALSFCDRRLVNRATGLAALRRMGLVWQSYLVSSATDSVQDWLTVPDVAEILSIPLGKVRRLIEEHHLISIRRNGVQSIPAELIVDGEPLPSLRGTILVLMDSGFDLDSAVEWLYTPNEVLDTTPIQALLSGRKTEIRRIAMALAL